MKKPTPLSARLLKPLISDSLYRNAVFLILSTVTIGLLGFLFWLIGTHLYSPQKVGLAATLVSVGTIIAELSLLGFNNTFIKYLPLSKLRNTQINTGLVVTTVAALVFSITYLLIASSVTPVFAMMSTTFRKVLFIVFVVSTSLNLVLESIFIAYRATVYIVIKNGVLGVTKLLLPALLVFLGAYGIVLSITSATCVAVLISLWFLMQKFEYALRPRLHRETLTRFAWTSATTYVANLFLTAPALLLPIIITVQLGPRSAAFFYIDLMFANILYIIPMSVSQSLFAEGAYEPDRIKERLIGSARAVLVLLTPTALVFVLAGRTMLSLYGVEYAAQGMTLFYFLVAASVFLAASHIGSTMLILHRKLKLFVGIAFATLALVVGTTYLCLPLGLYGVGLAWLCSYAFIAALYVAVLYRIVQLPLRVASGRSDAGNRDGLEG